MTSPPPTPSLIPGVHWIITANALKQINRLDPAAAQAAFDNASTYVIRGQKGAGVPSGWSSVLVASYKSYAQLQSDLAQGLVPAGVRGVLYDTEAWSLTPANEQLDPRHYIGLVAQLCHQHGLLLIAAPAVDLVKVLQPGAPDRYQAYLNLGLAAAATSADVVEIQAQSLEADAAAYGRFVTSAARQAQQAGGSHVLVLAGLSTGPTGHVVDSAQLTAAAATAQGVVNGYWLNVPGHSAECPTCTQPRPDLAVSFLRSLEHA